MITEQEYIKYKALIEEYEAALVLEEAGDDDWDIDDDDEYDPLESEFDNCHCGAYVIGKNGKVWKVSDCIC